VVTLEGAGRHGDDFVAFVRSLDEEIEVVAPNAPRFRVDYTPPPTLSRYWYAGESEGRPDPTTFGDCLFQVEQFVLDVLDRRQESSCLPYLVGFDQGAVLALASTEVIPDYLAGVVAICGYLPEIPGWEPPISDIAGLPVLLVVDPDDEDLLPSLTTRSRQHLLDEGAEVETVELRGARSLGSAVQHAVRGWLSARGT
jgi:predicted esterase